MILCIDVGNSQIFGGVFDNDRVCLRFRHASLVNPSSDQFGVFLKNVLRENNLDSNAIKNIAICSVVPHLDYAITSACIKYFRINPFILKAGVKTGIKINYKNPLEVGADRIANSVAAVASYPDKNLIIIDFGTATTICAISEKKEYLGGVILTGMNLAMRALQDNTAKLGSVEIIKPEFIIGKSTTESIQAGLYYSQLATIKYFCEKISNEFFYNTPPVIIGTGGFAHLFAEQSLFSYIDPDLVLNGLKLTHNINL